MYRTLHTSTQVLDDGIKYASGALRFPLPHRDRPRRGRGGKAGARGAARHAAAAAGAAAAAAAPARAAGPAPARRRLPSSGLPRAAAPPCRRPRRHDDEWMTRPPAGGGGRGRQRAARPAIFVGPPVPAAALFVAPWAPRLPPAAGARAGATRRRARWPLPCGRARRRAARGRAARWQRLAPCILRGGAAARPRVPVGWGPRADGALVCSPCFGCVAPPPTAYTRPTAAWVTGRPAAAVVWATTVRRGGAYVR